jgi:hypothetical protein
MTSFSFAAVYAGWQRDTARIDADQVRLRVYRDGEYFQLFTGVAPGIDFRPAVHGLGPFTFTQFQRAFADVSAEAAKEAIAEGRAPLSDPQTAIELFPDSKEAARRAPRLPDDPYGEAQTVLEWQA